MSNVSEFMEVCASVSMSKHFYLEVPEGVSKEEVIEKVKKELTSPGKIMKTMHDIIASRLGIIIKDAEDWDVDELEVVEA